MKRSLWARQQAISAVSIQSGMTNTQQTLQADSASDATIATT